ncbi:MAG TPA: hypothetical protein GXX55_08295 [Firmicutes bacterium]|nr:hypothetical protein [Bacillota bacterium]
MAEMKEERIHILQMLKEGKVTVDEAARLLEALDPDPEHGAASSASSETPGEDWERAAPAVRPLQSRFLRVRVLSSDGDKVNVNIPLSLAKLAMKFIPGEARARMEEQNIDLDSIVAAIEEGAEGKIVELSSGDGDLVEVYVE